MLMKTASAIGPVFDKETLRGTCPTEVHLSRFAQDLEDLEQLAMIRRIDTFIGGVPATSNQSSGATGAILTSQTAPPSSHLKVKFEFNHGFMCGVIREQMLRGQLDKLNSRIADFREQQQKECRHKFFSKASESLGRPQLNVSISPVDGSGFVGRTLTPTGAGMGNSRSPVVSDTRWQRVLVRRNSNSGVETVGVDRSHDGIPSSNTMTVLSNSSPESSATQQLHESEFEDEVSPVVSPNNASAVSVFQSTNTFYARPTFKRLKAGRVLVKKYCSMFSHLKLKGLKNARQWKTRYAVLQNARLLLQYDEGDPTDESAPLQQGPRHGTILSLKGAKVSACDPEVAAKVNCFQVEVSEWTKKGKLFKDQRRSFVIGVESDEEVDSWVYLIRYAIESLESHPASPQL
ncbi:Adenylate cyclase [Phytophthora cinnamomi]|uniref:Adenylate cyclase n=1 Tax=Phytophthora cinnamomi TaxID=4785 RepID=UPI0035594C65|nr:Adenylate cyclase [Phytophthora cinnamomi]